MHLVIASNTWVALAAPHTHSSYTPLACAMAQVDTAQLRVPAHVDPTEVHAVCSTHACMAEWNGIREDWCSSGRPGRLWYSSGAGQLLERGEDPTC